MEKSYKLQCLLKRKDIPDDAKSIIKRSIAEQEKERKEAQKYRALYREVPIGLYRTTPDGKILASNPYLIEILRYDSLEDIQTVNLEKKGFQPAYPRSEFKRALEEYESIKGLESIWKRKDNSLIYVRENAKAIRDESGNILYYEGSVEDITEQKKAENELLKTKTRLEYLLTSSPAIIYTCEPRGHYKTTFMSENIKGILGYLPEDFVDSPSFWETIIHPEDRDRVITGFKSTIESEYYRDVYRVKHKNGYYCWMFEENKLIKDDDDNPIEIIGYWTDVTDRKEAEEELRESENKYRTFFEQSLISTWEEDFSEVKRYIDELKKKGVRNLRLYLNDHPNEIMKIAQKVKVVNVNQTTVKMYAAETKEKLLTNLDKVFGDESYPVFKEELIALNDGKRTFESEGINYTLLGSPIHCLLKVAIVPGYEQNWSKLIVSLVDITERKLAEEALRASEARWRALVDHAPDIILTVDRKGLILFSNNPPAGLTQEEALSTSVYDYVEPQYREVVQQSINEVFQTGLPTDYEISARGPHDRLSWYATRLGPLIRNGEVHAVTLITRDITEQKNATDALRAERDQAQLYLDVVGVIIIAIDESQEVSLINKKGCEILGYNEEEILGKNWFDNFLPHRLRKGVKGVFNQLLAGDIEPVEFFENPVLTKSGEERTIAWHNTVLRNNKGDIIGTLSSGEDITERKQLEEVRHELEKRRENFIWMTSHELRTPITVILGYIEFLQKYFKELDRNRIERILKVMRNNIDRLERLTTDVAMISKIEQGFLEIDKRKLKLDDFLKEAVEPYKHLLGKQFIFNPPTESPVTLEIDKDRIQQVIDNILNNAIKNTSPKNRKISMDIETFSNKIQIDIADNGAGIHPNNLERIFEQFLSIETEYSATGTGIGLFISREIITAHGGAITAHSDGIGYGAKFTIFLPIKIP
jgi:PAS domain S-box-containing protein